MTVYTFFEYFLAFMIYSFFGWCMEVLLVFIENKKFVNRGFLLGPYCPIYGHGCLLIVLLLRRYMDNPLVLFVLAMVLCMSLEYLTSYLMELVFKARWWDYSDKKYNINGRVCLETAIPFGILGSLIMYLVHPFVMGIVSKFSKVSLLVVGGILLFIYFADNIVSLCAVSKINRFEFKKYKDSTEDITNMVREYLAKQTFLTKRLVKAFPTANVRHRKYKK